MASQKAQEAKKLDFWELTKYEDLHSKLNIECGNCREANSQWRFREYLPRSHTRNTQWEYLDFDITDHELDKLKGDKMFHKRKDGRIMIVRHYQGLGDICASCSILICPKCAIEDAPSQCCWSSLFLCRVCRKKNQHIDPQFWFKLPPGVQNPYHTGKCRTCLSKNRQTQCELNTNV